jgi:hypothetical protein
MTILQPTLNFNPRPAHVSEQCQRIIRRFMLRDWLVDVLELNQMGFGSALGRRLKEIRRACGGDGAIINRLERQPDGKMHSVYGVPAEYRAKMMRMVE